MVFLQAALNGDRQHAGVAKTPDAIGRDARTSVRAGAQTIHVHAYDDAGDETLNGTECSAVVRAIRRYCPGVEVSLTTSASIVPEPQQRLSAVRAWDLVVCVTDFDLMQPTGFINWCSD